MSPALRIWLRIALLLIAVVPRHVAAATLSGAVSYTGSQGPVSPTRPIRLFLFDAPNPEDSDPLIASVTSNGGAFNFNTPTTGDYYLAYVLDLDNNGDASVGEPFGVFNGKTDFPGDPIAVPRTGLAIQFGDTAAIPGIAGTVTYTGSMGPVSQSRPLIFESFLTPDLSGEQEDHQEISTNGGRYSVIIFDTTPLYARAFFDLNGSGSLDEGEPFQVYDDRSAPPGDPIVPGPTQTNVNFSFGDPGANGALLTGTVQYTGGQGSVSAEHPIRLFLFQTDPFTDEGHEVAATLVTTNGGDFELSAPEPGSYYLAYFFDVIPNSGEDDANVGEPFEVYDNRIAAPGTPLTVPQSNAQIAFNDAGRLPGIAGTVNYTGNLGPVSPNRPLHVESFSTADLAEQTKEDSIELAANGRYDLILFGSETLYLRAFLDLNDNGRLDDGEPFEIYNNRGAPPGDAVVSGPAQDQINFEFGDENAGPPPSPTPTPTMLGTSTATATVTRTRTPVLTPTPGACVGDCDGGGTVTVDELVKGVTIALGTAALDLCPEFDISGDEAVTVDELVAGVGGALNGCVTVASR